MSIMWCWIVQVVVGVLLILDVVQAEETLTRTRRASSDCECGVGGDDLSNRIVGGKISKPHKYPWVVEMIDKGRFRCAGSIINDKHILTAGHCVENSMPQELTIVLSIFNITRPGEGIQTEVESILVHPGFSHTPLRVNNDIAILKLKYPIKFSRDIGPICLPPADTDFAGVQATAIGWGSTREHGFHSDVLKETRVTILSHETCAASELGDQLTNAMLCAYAVQTDTCKGDSGGPLMVAQPHGRYHLVGIISWGWGCDRLNLPGVYTKIQVFLDWISQNTRDGTYCNR